MSLFYSALFLILILLLGILLAPFLGGNKEGMETIQKIQQLRKIQNLPKIQKLYQIQIPLYKIRILLLMTITIILLGLLNLP